MASCIPGTLTRQPMVYRQRVAAAPALLEYETLMANRHFQRFGTFRVSVAGDHEDVVVLTGLPNRRVGSIRGQVEILKRTEHTLQLTPEANPRWPLANVYESADLSLHVVVREDT